MRAGRVGSEGEGVEEGVGALASRAAPILVKRVAREIGHGGRHLEGVAPSRRLRRKVHREGRSCAAYRQSRAGEHAARPRQPDGGHGERRGVHGLIEGDRTLDQRGIVGRGASHRLGRGGVDGQRGRLRDGIAEPGGQPGREGVIAFGEGRRRSESDGPGAGRLLRGIEGGVAVEVDLDEAALAHGHGIGGLGDIGDAVAVGGASVGGRRKAERDAGRRAPHLDGAAHVVGPVEEAIARPVEHAARAVHGHLVEVVGQAIREAQRRGLRLRVVAQRRWGGDGDLVAVTEGPVAAAPQESVVGRVGGRRRVEAIGVVEGHAERLSGQWPQRCRPRRASRGVGAAEGRIVVARLIAGRRAEAVVEGPVAEQARLIACEAHVHVGLSRGLVAHVAPETQVGELPAEGLIGVEAAADAVLFLPHEQRIAADGQRREGRRLDPEAHPVEEELRVIVVGIAGHGEMVPRAIGHRREGPDDLGRAALAGEELEDAVSVEGDQELVVVAGRRAADDALPRRVRRAQPELDRQVALPAEHVAGERKVVVGAVEGERRASRDARHGGAGRVDEDREGVRRRAAAREAEGRRHAVGAVGQGGGGEGVGAGRRGLAGLVDRRVAVVVEVDPAGLGDGDVEGGGIVGRKGVGGQEARVAGRRELERHQWRRGRRRPEHQRQEPVGAQQHPGLERLEAEPATPRPLCSPCLPSHQAVHNSPRIPPPTAVRSPAHTRNHGASRRASVRVGAASRRRYPCISRAW